PWVVDAADGVHGHERGDERAVRQYAAGGTDAGFDGAGRAIQLGYRRASTGADTTFGDALIGRLAGGVAGRGVRSDVGAANAEVEERRGRHDWHRARLGRKADAPLFE